MRRAASECGAGIHTKRDWSVNGTERLDLRVGVRPGDVGPAGEPFGDPGLDQDRVQMTLGVDVLDAEVLVDLTVGKVQLPLDVFDGRLGGVELERHHYLAHRPSLRRRRAVRVSCAAGAGGPVQE